MEYKGGLPLKTKQNPELSSGGWSPHSVGSPTRWVVQEPICISVPAGVVVRGSVWLQWIFFGDSFKEFAHFMMGDLPMHLFTLHWVFSSFSPKTAWPLCLTFPVHLISPQATFFPPGWKNSSKGNVLPMWKRWNKKWQKH